MPQKRYRYIHRERGEKQKLLVLTNGQTEKEYFDCFPKLGRLLKIECYGKESSKSLLSRAIETRKRLVKKSEYFEDKDETWIVIDRDSHPANPNDRQSFVDVLRAAEKNNIEAAYSNQAFELWYLLHFKYKKDAINAEELELRLNKELNRAKINYRYLKPAKEMFRLIKSKQEQAIEHAKKLHATKANVHPADANPSTNIYKLIEKLRAMSRR